MLVRQERREDETEGGCRNSVSGNERRRSSTACKSDQLHTNMEQKTHFQLTSVFTFTFKFTGNYPSASKVLAHSVDLVVFVFLAVLTKWFMSCCLPSKHTDLFSWESTAAACQLKRWVCLQGKLQLTICCVSSDAAVVLQTNCKENTDTLTPDIAC